MAELFREARSLGGRDRSASAELSNDYLDFKAKAKDGAVLSAECLLSPIWAGGERRIVAVLRDFRRGPSRSSSS